MRWLTGVYRVSGRKYRFLVRLIPVPGSHFCTYVGLPFGESGTRQLFIVRDSQFAKRKLTMAEMGHEKNVANFAKMVDFVRLRCRSCSDERDDLVGVAERRFWPMLRMLWMTFRPRSCCGKIRSGISKISTPTSIGKRRVRLRHSRPAVHLRTRLTC